jgi:hypothetical protein
VKELAAEEIVAVSLGVGLRRLGRPRDRVARDELHPERIDDRPGDLVLGPRTRR